MLLATLAVFAYRDVWPLMTFELEPLDKEEGALLWIKFAFLIAASTVIPGMTPRVYVPVDAQVCPMFFQELPLLNKLCMQEPMERANPEQTASMLSFLTYSYLDSLVILANRVPHLPYDELPPLSDTSYAKHLMKTAQPVLLQIFSKFVWLLTVNDRSLILSLPGSMSISSGSCFGHIVSTFPPRRQCFDIILTYTHSDYEYFNMAAMLVIRVCITNH